jgi:hypothetical protein
MHCVGHHQCRGTRSRAVPLTVPRFARRARLANPVNTPYSIVDPCGGPKELLSKINPSPCVLVIGEAEVSAGYANINTHGNVTITRPLQRGTDLPIAGNANVYPLLLLAFGVSANAQFQISLPSDVHASTLRLGSTNATTDTAFNYKQLVYFSPTKFTLAAVDLGYTAPTGGGSLGPAYSIQPQWAQPLNQNVSVGAFWTFKDALSATSPGVTERGWSDPLGLYLSWSPALGGFGFFPIVTHEFNPNRTVVTADAAYLFNRHVLLNVSYGGLAASAVGTGGFAHAVTFSANVNPRIFAANFYFLIGESNLPPTPPAPAATPAP